MNGAENRSRTGAAAAGGGPAPTPVHGGCRGAVSARRSRRVTRGRPTGFEPRSRGFSRFGFSHRFRLGDPLQPVRDVCAGVPVPLVADVVDDPRQVARPEADHPVPGLPLQDLPAELWLASWADDPFNWPTNSLMRTVGAMLTARWTWVSIPPTSWTYTPGVLMHRPRR